MLEVHCCAVEFTPVTSSYRICMLGLYAAFVCWVCMYAAFAVSRNVDNVPSATAARASYFRSEHKSDSDVLGAAA